MQRAGRRCEPVFSALVWRSCNTQGLNLAALNAETDRRGFVPVDEQMRLLDKNGKVVPHVYCIGDANGKLMLAHAASAQARTYPARPAPSSSSWLGSNIVCCRVLLTFNRHML